MARPLRLQYPGALYHVTARGNERKPTFRSDKDRETFLAVLAKTVERQRLILHAYVLMDNHYHLLLETREANLARALRDLNGVYTASFNRTHRRVGHLFQGRYKAILVEKENYLLELSRYIHLNPVRALMGVRLSRYRWSSYLDYIGRRESPEWLTREEVLRYWGSRRAGCEARYQRFVEEGVKRDVGTPWEKVVAQVVLGGERFVRSVQQRIGGKRDREVPSHRHLETRPSWETIQKGVANLSQELKRLGRGNRANPERVVMIYLGREQGGMPLKALAKRLGMDISAVSQAAGRVARLRESRGEWDEVIRRIERSLKV